MKTKRNFTLGLIGCGHMGLAIARGAVAKEYIERYKICVYDPYEGVKNTCKMEGFTFLNSEKEVADNSHITLLAVKPQEIETVIEHLKDADIHVLLSIVTGVSIEKLQSSLGNVAVIRSMPNTPLQISEGATALCKSENCKADDYDFIFQLFNSMGVTKTLPEQEITESVSVHGSTPAYFYYFAQCIIEDAIERGMDPEAARALVVQTMIGSGKLLAANPKKPIEDFVDEVCSKGGTTIEAIEKFKELKLKDMVHEADTVCIKRAKELGQ